MAHCAHVLSPSCAWAESTQPKKRSSSIVSRLGNAIRAMKPVAKRSEEEQVCVLNAAALLEIEHNSVKQALSDDDISTQSGGSRRSSKSSAFPSRKSSVESPESVEEFVLPGSPQESLPSSSPSRKSSRSSSEVEEFLLPGSPQEISQSSSPSCNSERSELNSELHALATVIADQAKSKFSGRVYQDVRDAFLAVDTNGDGKLTPTEALAFCQHFDLSPTTTSRFFTLLDHRETGLADWSSFLARYAPVFTKKIDFRRNAGEGRNWPAIQ